MENTGNMRNWKWSLYLLVPAVLSLQVVAQAQSDDYLDYPDHERPKSGFTNPFSKMFSKKPSEEADGSRDHAANSATSRNSGLLGGLTSQGRNAAAENNPPAGNAQRGGLFVPLKSFTNRVFNRGADHDDFEDVSAQQQPPYPSRTDSYQDPFEVGNAVSNTRARIVHSRERAEASLQDLNDQVRTRGNEVASEIQAEVDSLHNSITTSFPGEDRVFAREPRGAASQKSDSKINLSESLAPIATGAPSGAYPGSGLDENKTSRRASDNSTANSTQDSAIVKPILNSPAKPSQPNLIDLSLDAPATTPAKTAQTPAPRNMIHVSSDRSLAKQAEIEIDTAKTVKLPSTATPVPSVDAPSLQHAETDSTRHSEVASVPALPSLSALPNPGLELPAQNVASEQSGSTSSTGNRIDLRKSTTSGFPSGAAAQASVTLGSMQLPGVKVAIQGPESLLVGQETMFEISAHNEGQIDLNGLILRLSVPPNVVVGNVYATDGAAESEMSDEEKAIVWELPVLPKNGHRMLRITLQTNKPEHFAMGVEWTAIPQMQEYSIQVQQARLELAIEGASEAEFGTPLNYRLRVKNPGNAVAKNVSLTLDASSFGTNTSDIGDIGPGEEKMIDVELLFQQSGVIPITASAKSNDSAAEADSAIDVRVRQAVLEANWTGPQSHYQGTVAEYQMQLTNSGDAPAIDTVVTFQLPAAAQAVRLPEGATQDGMDIHVPVRKLMPRESIELPLHLTFGATGTNTLTMNVDCKTGLDVSNQISTEVDSIVDLQLVVHDPVAPAPVLQNVHYDLEIFNRGQKTATDVDVLVQFSEGIEPMKSEGNEARIVPGQVIFKTIPEIKAGERVKLRVVAEASQEGVHRFRVEVKSANGEADLLQEASTRFLHTRSSGR